MKISIWTIGLIIVTCLIFFSAWNNNIKLSERSNECIGLISEGVGLSDIERDLNSEEFMMCVASEMDYGVQRDSYKLFIGTFIILSLLSFRVDNLKKKK